MLRTFFLGNKIVVDVLVSCSFVCVIIILFSLHTALSTLLHNLYTNVVLTVSNVDKGVDACN